jgi:hypothetical protein
MTMSANNRLQELQSALKERGLRDAKFCFSLGLAEMPRSEVVSGVSDFLDAYVKGRFTVVDRIGDAEIPAK